MQELNNIEEERVRLKETYGVTDSTPVEDMTDNLSIRYPALIEGIVPERIFYMLLQEVLKRFLDRGYSPIYLPEIIEVMDNVLYENPGISAEQLSEQVCAAHVSKTSEYLGAFLK